MTAEADLDADLRSLLSGNSSDVPPNPHHGVPLDHHDDNTVHPPLPVPDLERQGSCGSHRSFGSHRSVPSPSNVRTKRALYLIGCIILAMGFVGPSGFLWLLIEEDDVKVPPAKQEENFVVTKEQLPRMPRKTSVHGDRHHHLSPNFYQQQRGPHPRTSHETVAKAAGSRKHEQFGEMRKKKKQKTGDQQGNFVSNIKDAIDNLDKVFYENRPVAGSTQVKPQKRKKKRDDDDSFLVDDEHKGALPFVHVDDDHLPKNAEALDEITYSLPASDALECRTSVKAFVINATDVKDECDGLRKAFDKTCSVQHLPSAGNPAPATSRRRRRLQEWGKPHLTNLIPETFREEMNVAGRRVKRRWKNRIRRRLEQTGDGLIDGDAQDNTAAPQHEDENPPPMVSLNIPTANLHVSEEMLNDALLLQNSNNEKVLTPATVSADAPKIELPSTQEGHGRASPTQSADSQHNINNSTNSNVNPESAAQAAEAVQDAAESAEAIRTAVDEVKKATTDPKSIEARTCCASILSVFHEHCDPTTTGVEDYSDRRLLVVVFVITVCGMIKSLIRHMGIRWLPEAGGCILVGVFGYLILQNMPHIQFAFDGDMFLRIMVPPIVFEAAVKINKRSFRRHIVPIAIFSIIGTLASTAFTAAILHKGSSLLHHCTTIPVKESMVFGALISSIDPIAVLSVLNSMGMTDADTIYVLIFGESLLNDGVAIVLFQTLVHFLDESLVIDGDVVADAAMHFFVVAIGSIAVGAFSGACATIYFASFHGCQTPMVEVIMFCCWSFIPYYICDMVEWSGIVAIVANGFVMDLYVIGQKQSPEATVDEEIEFLVNGASNGSVSRARQSRQQWCLRIFNYEGHLSQIADSHVHFVIEIFATLMETAIFAYLGLFLFSPRYHWNGYLTAISIFATVMGRCAMVPVFSHLANVFNKMSTGKDRPSCLPHSDKLEGVHIDRRMQLVLVFAGLRGAMSFALVEHIPMFDTTTLQGSRLKPELKAMTSASVMFTVFILGGATSFLMESLGYSSRVDPNRGQDELEIAPLMQKEKRGSNISRGAVSSGVAVSDNGSRHSNSSMRQRSVH